MHFLMCMCGEYLQCVFYLHLHCEDFQHVCCQTNENVKMLVFLSICMCFLKLKSIELSWPLYKCTICSLKLVSELEIIVVHLK